MASTDLQLSGEWKIFSNATIRGYDKVGSVTSSPMGLEHKIYDENLVEVSKINFTSSMFSSAPVDFTCTTGDQVIPGDLTQLQPSLSSCFSSSCASDSSFLDISNNRLPLPNMNCYSDSFLRDLEMPVEPHFNEKEDQEKTLSKSMSKVQYSNLKPTVDDDDSTLCSEAS